LPTTVQPAAGAEQLDYQLTAHSCPIGKREGKNKLFHDSQSFTLQQNILDTGHDREQGDLIPRFSVHPANAYETNLSNIQEQILKSF